MGDYVIRFAATLDPNGDGAPNWPLYTKECPQLLTFSDDEPKLTVMLDTYREGPMAYITRLSLSDPI